ncbi:MAG: potassium channel family protein [Candidatus Competibacteraceae bacterium]|nr:potassium channel family protein [Candidatus Competibacteraceae bacterium]
MSALSPDLWLGAGLIAMAMVDLVWSTLSTNGGGPLTRWTGRLLWALLLGLHRRLPRLGWLNIAGVIITLTTSALWIGLLWCGWTLVFNADPAAVVEASTGKAADFWERVYFAGFTVFTLGVGDYRPLGDGWRFLTALASLNGLTAVTLAITYLMPLVSAAVQKHQLAATIDGLGATPANIVIRGWNGRDFRGLELVLVGLSSTLTLHAERHLAYPVVHFFHNRNPATALAPRLAALDEALTLLLHAVASANRPDPAVLANARSAVNQYLQKLRQDYIRPAREVPPPSELETLERAGVPLGDPADYRRALEDLRDRRRLLLGLVEQDGWRWQEVSNR